MSEILLGWGGMNPCADPQSPCPQVERGVCFLSSSLFPLKGLCEGEERQNQQSFHSAGEGKGRLGDDASLLKIYHIVGNMGKKVPKAVCQKAGQTCLLHSPKTIRMSTKVPLGDCVVKSATLLLQKL